MEDNVFFYGPQTYLYKKKVISDINKREIHLTVNGDNYKLTW